MKRSPKDLLKNGEGICDFGVLRQLRKREKWSIAELSERSGVSASVISKLERNRNAVGIETLFRLAKAFGMTLSDLIAFAENSSSHLTKTERYTSGGFQFQRVVYGNMRCMSVRAAAGASLSTPELHRDDFELCWVLKGKLEFHLPGENHLLGKGDCIQFDALLHHTYRALEETDFIIVHLRKPKRF